MNEEQNYSWRHQFWTAVVVVLGIGVWLSWMAKPGAKHGGGSDSSLVRMSQLGRSILAYASDYDDRLPSEKKWGSSVVTYLPDQSYLRDPFAEPEMEYGLAFFAKVGGAHAGSYENSHQIPMILQTWRDEPDLALSPEFLPHVARAPNGRDLYTMLDGSAQFHKRNWTDTMGLIRFDSASD